MDATDKPTKKDVKPKKRAYGLFMKNILTRKVKLPFVSVGSNIKENLQKIMVAELEGRGVLEGYIKPNSVRVTTYSAGELVSNEAVFYVIIECLICNPPEGMNIKVRAVNITKAGIRAESTFSVSPIDVFIARDHNYKNKHFSSIKVGDVFTIKVIGQRYEINDPTISVLAVIKRVKKKRTEKKQNKIIIV